MATTKMKNQDIELLNKVHRFVGNFLVKLSAIIFGILAFLVLSEMTRDTTIGAIFLLLIAFLMWTVGDLYAKKGTKK